MKTIDSSNIFGAIPICPYRGVSITVCHVEAHADADFTSALSCTGHTSLRWCDAEAAVLMGKLQTAIDPRARTSLLTQLFQREADQAIGLPLFAGPVVSVWRSDQVAGPIGTWAGTPYGLYFNINEWTVAS